MPTKAMRIKDHEDKAIREFLEKNPYFDFSTLARMAILQFIENPEIKLKPQKLDKKSKRIQ